MLTVSVHGDPATEYPFFLGHADETRHGCGRRASTSTCRCRGTGLAAWRVALDTALQAVADFGAQALVVPLGLDTFAGDPISGFTLQSADYLGVGAALASAGLPTVFTFEGGYAVDRSRCECGERVARLRANHLNPPAPQAQFTHDRYPLP